jgi:hypothetical protein
MLPHSLDFTDEEKYLSMNLYNRSRPNRLATKNTNMSSMLGQVLLEFEQPVQNQPIQCSAFIVTRKIRSQPFLGGWVGVRAFKNQRGGKKK